MSVGQLARHRSTSSGSKPFVRSSTPSDVVDVYPDLNLQPCAATATTFLFAQGRRILCLRHGSLGVERKFEKHKAPVHLLSVDNVSERGSGRLAASCDSDQTAIVWDVISGDELSRFSYYQHIRVAAWMKNGNVAFGNDRGEVIIFEPATKEHESARTIYDPITAIAPGADCQTFAIGYQNGSILIASLLPSFTILHTLTTSVAPSPITGLAWHGSSSKQKSDMLAVQMASGDLRVWSIAKPAGADVPKTIRNLERGDTVEPGLNWIAWSKNGRIIQYSQGETWAWDVRNKHVAYEPIPTVDGITGIANYGPSAALFTLGPNLTVQQYSLSPPSLIKNVRHDPNAPPSLNTTPKMSQKSIPGAAPPMPVYMSYDASRGPASLSAIQRASDMQAAEHARQMRSGMGSPLSTTSRTESIDSRSIDSMSSAGFRDRAPSVAASGTTFSTVSPSYIARESAASPFWPQTASVASSGRRSKSSRLRHEVLRSPEGNLVDLFPYTRARLASLPYAPENSNLDQSTASAAELRQQMLRIVFGWDGDIEDMIRDELSRHPQGSMNATLLAKWLGEMSLDLSSMMGSDSVTSTDWMMLALSNMGGQGEVAKQIGRNFTQKLLQQGDIHTAATVLLGLNDRDQAVDVYISRNYFMEGILLTCVLFPEEWQRQASLVRRWGEYVVENSQQHLAIRCFTCTGTDTSIPWASPTQSPFAGSHLPPTAAQTLSPPTSPPPNEKQGVTRMTPKTSSLKLITSFGPNEKDGFRFPGLKTDDRTPTNAPGVTPIAESALSPGGTPSSYLRPPLRAKPPSGSTKHRLPSIGETPIDVNPPQLPMIRPDSLPTPDNSGSEREKEPKLSIITTPDPSKHIDAAPLTLSSARYDPKEAVTPKGQTPQTAVPTTAVRTSLLSNSDVNAMAHAQEKSRTRNGSRDRKPTGLHIQMPTLEQLNLNAIATGSDGRTPISGRRKSNSSSLHSGSSRDARVELISPPVTGQSWTSSTKSPSISGRSMDPYISSLDEAQYHAQKQKVRTHRSREGRTGEHKSRSKGRHRQPSEDRNRGRSGHRYIKPAKRSPSSPVPMSPEDLQQYRDQHSQSLDSMVSRDSSPEDGPRGQSTHRINASKNRSHSKFSDASHVTARRASPSGMEPENRFQSRGASPDRHLTPIDVRGRSRSKNGGSVLRSPSSPLPMSPQAKLYQAPPDDYIESDPMKLVEQNRQRLRSQQRSASRKPRERGTSSRRDVSTDRRRLGEERPLLQVDSTRRESPRTSDMEKGGSDGASEHSLKRTKSHKSLKRELAARELEARRESLHARTNGVVVLPPVSGVRPTPPARTQSDFTNFATAPGDWKSVTSPQSTHSVHSFSGASVSSSDNPPDRAASVGPYGLPSTPRAMRHPKYSSRDEGIPAVPAVPEVPDQYYATGQPMRELPRSMSAPVPEPDTSVPTDMPMHPAFQRGVRPSTKRPNFAPLDTIGKTTRQRSPSIDATNNSGVLASIGETLHGVVEEPVIDVPELANASPGIIPELQHLAMPPPPPPPPMPPFGENMAHHSLSSGSGVGTINIVMDEGSRSGTPVIEVGGIDVPPMPPAKDGVNSPPLPPLPLSAGKYSPPHSGHSTNGNMPVHNISQPPSTTATPSGEAAPRGHRRGRSIDQFGNKIARMTERMRSTSRGRNNATKSPKPVDILKPSPYETRVENQGSHSYF